MKKVIYAIMIFLFCITKVRAQIVPVYRFWSQQKKALFLTSSVEERNTLLKDPKWQYDGIAFYAMSGGNQDSTPVYRLFNPSRNIHYYTADRNEMAQLIKSGEWIYEGIAFYALPNAADKEGATPVFKLFNPSTGTHFFTTLPAERDALQEEGFYYEGTVFKTFPSWGGYKLVGVHMPPFQRSWEGPGPFEDYKNSLLSFYRETGKQHMVVMFFSSWENDEGMYGFGNAKPEFGEKYQAGWIAGQIVESGAIPMITWEPWKDGAGINQPKYSLDRIIAGEFDSYIRQFARDVKRFGYPVLIRFAHEMNGNYYPWSCPLNAHDPSKYVKAFRHVREIFWKEGAHNAFFVWSPNYASPPEVKAPCNDLEALYPGDDAVDFIGVSVYNWGSDTSRGPGWKELDYLLEPFIRHMATHHPDKWIIIAETGCAHDKPPADVAEWIRNAYRYLARKGNVAAVVYFNDFAYHNPSFTDFRVTTGPIWTQYPVPSEITQAYSEAIKGYFP